MDIRIAEAAFDPQQECAQFLSGRQDAGALVSFVGICRSETDGREVSALTLQQYEGYTLPEISRLAEEISLRFSCPDILVIHRVGTIGPGEAIVLVAALSEHRENAFDAVRLLMDYLKTDAPLWKKETGPQTSRWVEPRIRDRERRALADEVVA